MRKKIEKTSRNFFELFFRNIFWSPVSRIVPKNVKGVPWGVFEYPFFCKIEKIEGGTLWRHLKKLRKKVSQSRKNLHKKCLVMGGTRTRKTA